MKKAAKRLMNYLAAGILIFIAFAVAFGQYLIVTYLTQNTPWKVLFVLLAFAGVYFLVGFIAGDLKVARYRRKEKNWNGTLPQEIKDGAWQRRYALFLAAIVTALAAGIMELIALGTGVIF